MPHPPPGEYAGFEETVLAPRTAGPEGLLRVAAEPQEGQRGRASAATRSSNAAPQALQVKSNIGIGVLRLSVSICLNEHRVFQSGSETPGSGSGELDHDRIAARNALASARSSRAASIAPASPGAERRS